MLWKMIFIFFSTSQAHMIRPNFKYSDTPIYQCVYHFYQCNPNIDSPCCEENNTCTLVHWNGQNFYECLKTITLDKPCLSNSDCSDLESVICSPEKKVCECSNNYLRINNHKCASLLGSSCVENSDCAIPNSICHKNKCKCKSSFHKTSNNNCVPTTLEKPCSADIECWTTNNTVCSESGTCSCSRNFQEINNAACASFLGGYCRDYRDCWPDNSVCLHNQCQCQYGFIPISYKKCQASPLGMICVNDVDCNPISLDSTPTEWEYVCEEHKSFGYFLRCGSLLGNFCRLQEHCLIDNSHCISDTCQCKDGYISKSNRECVKILNESCRSNNDCNIESNHICSNDKKCACKKGYVELEDRTCAPALGSDCSETSPCVAVNSECFENMCHCKADHIPKSGTECVPFWM